MDNGEEKKCGDHPVQFSTGPSSRPEWSNTQGQVAPPSGGGIRYTTDDQARARSAAGCAYCLLAFGIFMFIPGGILTGEGYKRRDSDFFATRDAAFRVIGPLLLCLASVLLLVGLSFAWVIGLMCLKEKRTARTMPPQTVGPIVSGTYPGHGNVIQYSGAPPPGPAYPPQGHGGTTGVEYTSPPPGGAIVPPQVAPQDTCRPIGPSAPPENNGTADLPPPPSYDAVV